MFRKRVRREFPEGTFIPMPARVFAILQLCLAFTVLAWVAGEPFMGQLFKVKSKMLVYEALMKDRGRFDALPDKEVILASYAKLQEQLQRPFWEKAADSMRGIANLPAFVLLWIFLSIVIPILVLKKVEGALQAALLLPLAAATYAVENRVTSLPPVKSVEERIFPTEAEVVRDYVGAPLSEDILEQHLQLKKGWEEYLSRVWGNGDGAEAGLFAFHRAWVKALDEAESEPKSKTQEPLLLLGAFLFWNLSFALVVRQYPKDKGTQGTLGTQET